MKCNVVVIKILRLSFIGMVQTILYFLELQGLEEEILVAHLQNPSPELTIVWSSTVWTSLVNLVREKEP